MWTAKLKERSHNQNVTIRFMLNNKPIFFIFMEPSSFRRLGNQLTLRPTLSHDFNMINIAKVAITSGLAQPIFFCYDDAHFTRPFGLSNPETLAIKKICSTVPRSKISALFSVHAEHLRLKTHLGKQTIGVHMLPAHYLVENPLLFNHEDIERIVEGLRDHTDLFVFQNERMLNTAEVLYGILARWTGKKRAIICPLGIDSPINRSKLRADARNRLNFKNEDVVLLNSGGIYKWSDFNTFLIAFCELVESGHQNLKLIISGFSQENNFDHLDYINQTKRILARFANTVEKNILIAESWKTGGDMMGLYLSAADIGLNVNPNSLETWQSHRVRNMNYLKYGLPILNSGNSLIGELEMCLNAEPGNIDSYKTKILECQDHQNLVQLSEKTTKIQKQFSNELNYTSLIKKVLASQRVTKRSEIFSGPSIFSRSRRRQVSRKVADVVRPYRRFKFVNRFVLIAKNWFV